MNVSATLPRTVEPGILVITPKHALDPVARFVLPLKSEKNAATPVALLIEYVPLIVIRTLLADEEGVIDAVRFED